MEKLDHELESHILGSTGIGGGEQGGWAGVLTGAFRRQDDGDFGRGRGRERLRIWERVWGKETLRLVVGVDAVAGADASLQRAWAELAGRIGSRR
jgi:hypothetical protein